MTLRTTVRQLRTRASYFPASLHHPEKQLVFWIVEIRKRRCQDVVDNLGTDISWVPENTPERVP